MSERYVVKERQGYNLFGVVVDSTTDRDLCDADCCEAPEDASVHRHFAPLLDELNVLATRLTTSERELAEARAALMTDALPMPAEDYPIARRLREERDHYRGLVAAADTTRREWEVRAATSYRDGRAAGLREAAEMLDAERPGHSKGVVNVLGAMAARMRTRALAPPAAETVRSETTFGCRTCDASTSGWTDGRFASPGWGRIDHIDGPNAICPVCAADPTALDCLREEYPDVAIAAARCAPSSVSRVRRWRDRAMRDHDPDDAEMRAWLADGKAPAGVCPHCGSRISVVQRDGQFTARCSHRGCGASGPRMATLVRAVEQFCAPPAYVARHMGISVHPSSLTDVVSVLEAERDEADTTRREWEVRAATSYRDGRAAGLREAAGVCMELGGNALSIAWVNAADECERRIRALAPPAAETEVDRG